MSDVFVAKVKGRGLAVFADRKFKKGETVILEPIIVLANNDWKQLNETVLHEYYFGRKFDFLALGYVSLMAHASLPNLEWSANKSKREVRFTALRSISKNSELCFDYGWEHYPWEKNKK